MRLRIPGLRNPGQGWGGPAPSPPGPVRGAVVRWTAALALVAVFGGGGWGTASFFRRQAALRRGPDVPFHPDSLVGVSPNGHRHGLPKGRRTVVLYVSAHCPYCRAELRAWAARLADTPGGEPPWIITAPDTELREAIPILRPFGGHWMSDPTGAVGRSLQIRAVPFTAVVDSGGVVVETAAGESSPARLAHFASLLQESSEIPEE